MSAVQQSEPEYVDDRYLAATTPISRVTWQTYRQRGGGPPFMKVGRRVIYALADVRTWFAARKVGA